MTFEPIYDPKRRWIIGWANEWAQITGGCNWYNFTPIKLTFEWDKMMGALQLETAIIGLHITIRYQYAITDKLREILRQRDEILDTLEDK